MVSPSCTNDVNSYAWNARKPAPRRQVAHNQSFDEPRMRSPVVCFGTLRFSTAASASTIASDDMSSTNVDADVTGMLRDRKSTRLNSSHGYISYAVFCLKKKNCRPES